MDNNNNNIGFKKGSKNRPIITVANKNQSKVIFSGTKKQHERWMSEVKFKYGTIHHVYYDEGNNNISYFRATKK